MAPCNVHVRKYIGWHRASTWKTQVLRNRSWEKRTLQKDVPDAHMWKRSPCKELYSKYRPWLRISPRKTCRHDGASLSFHREKKTDWKVRDRDSKFAFLQHQHWSHPFVSYRHRYSRATLPRGSTSPRHIRISGNGYLSHWEIFPEARHGSIGRLSQHLRGRGRDITASSRSRFQATQRYIMRSCLKKEKRSWHTVILICVLLCDILIHICNIMMKFEYTIR